jgi:hypothetical protein
MRNCQECGEPIPQERLVAEPTTTLCVPCKTRLGKRPKLVSKEKPEKLRTPSKRGKRRRRFHTEEEDFACDPPADSQQ